MSKVFVKILISILFLPLGLYSQGTSQILDIGDEYFDKKDFHGAYYYYKKAINIDSSNADVLYKYALSLSELNQNEKAARYFLKSSLIDRGKKYPDVYYRLAESYRSAGDYRKARRYYNKALIPFRSNRKAYWYRRIDQNKKSNTWAMKQSVLSKDIQNVGKEINTSQSEFGATIYDNKLFYTSLRADSLNEDGSMNDRSYLSRIYYQDLKKGSKPNVLRISSNSKEDISSKNWANFSLDDENKIAYFSICDTSFNCEIWSGRFNSSQIEVSQAKPLNKNINSSGSNNTQGQTIRLNGEEHLLFVSDREKGFGAYDIWISKKEDYGFDTPVNLGSKVNSIGNEISPFYHNKSKLLFFSSDWHYGFGGYDNFKAIGELKNIDKLENLGNPINSAQDDYYFFAESDRALISSNRSNESQKSINSCCNDLYAFDYQIETLEEKIDSSPIIEDVISLNKYLPLNLYFHNDSPDPRTRDTTTNKNYKDLVEDYLELEEEYRQAIINSSTYATDENELRKIEKFFNEDIIKGIEDLEFFTPLLKNELEKGKKIQLTIKGFASSLFSSEYNLNLTLRRIQSLINYFAKYENGVLLPYLIGNSRNGGSLKIQKLPYGEFASKIELDENDLTSSIYSTAAAEQRKIEMIAIEELEEGLRSLDGGSTFSNPKIEFNKKSYNIGKVDADKVQRFFNIKNTGGSDLIIYNVIDNCDCVEIDYKSIIPSKQEEKLKLSISTKNLEGVTKIEITLISNTQPNIHNLEIRLEK